MPFGPAERKLKHVFRDRDELPASGDLGSELRAALEASRYQIVICSPSAAKSKWVNEEILLFKRFHGEGRTLALIASGEPYAGDDTECFPPALRYLLGPDGELSTNPAEPTAADIRPGKDGRRLALMKILAGISGVRLDDLTRRDTARRQKVMAGYVTVSSAVTLLTLGLAIYAEGQRQVAVAQRDLAENSLAFLTETFEIANPATENPRTITALAILDRASHRASEQFTDNPAVAVRLLRTTGNIYFNLGLLDESERDLAGALKLESSEGDSRAQTLLRLAALARKRGDVEHLQELISAAEAANKDGSGNRKLIEAMIVENRADMAYLKADYSNAATLYGQSARMFGRLDGDHRTEVGATLMDQATSLVQANEFDKVDAIYARARSIFADKYGQNGVKTARAAHNQAFARLSAGDPDAANVKMMEALQTYERVFDPDHPDLAVAHLMMGRIQSAQTEHEAAIASFGKARAIFVKLYGADNPAVGDVDFYSAEAASEAGSVAQALSFAASAGRTYDAAYGPDDPDQAELLLLRSRILSKAGRVVGARQECWKALSLQRRIGAADTAIQQTDKLCSELEAA